MHNEPREKDIRVMAHYLYPQYPTTASLANKLALFYDACGYEGVMEFYEDKGQTVWRTSYNLLRIAENAVWDYMMGYPY